MPQLWKNKKKQQKSRDEHPSLLLVVLMIPQDCHQLRFWMKVPMSGEQVLNCHLEWMTLKWLKIGMEELFWLEDNHHHLSNLTPSINCLMEVRMLCGLRWNRRWTLGDSGIQHSWFLTSLLTVLKCEFILT